MPNPIEPTVWVSPVEYDDGWHWEVDIHSDCDDSQDGVAREVILFGRSPTHSAAADAAQAAVPSALAAWAAMRTDAMPPADLLDAMETAPGDGARRDGSEVPE